MLDAAARKGVALSIETFADPTHTADEAARAVGAEVGQIVKSLVFVAPSADGLEPILALVSGSNRVDVARLAAVLGLHGVRPATAREADDITGFVIGGIPPIGHTRQMRVVMDPDLGRFETVWAAAGTQNGVFSVPPGTLRTLANAMVAPIAQDRSASVRESGSAAASTVDAATAESGPTAGGPATASLPSGA